MHKVTKGNYGYFAYQKQWSAVRTVAFFSIGIAIFIAGYLATKTKLNLSTVVAILAMLPASKSFVNMIMFLKNKGCSEEFYREVKDKTEGLTALYDLVMTSYDKTFSISSLVMKGHSICAFTEKAETETEAAEKHIGNILKNAGLNGYTVKVFREKEKYLQRLEQMRQSETGENRNQNTVVENLLSVSL